LCGLELVYEGLKFRGWSKTSGLIESVFLAFTWLMSFFWITQHILPPQAWVLDYPQNFWILIVAALFVRFGIFDLLLNKVRGKPWTYLGNSKVIDIVITWLLEKTRMPMSFFVFIRLCLFIVGSLLLLNGNTDKIMLFH
jgi:hypothetical protein